MTMKDVINWAEIRVIDSPGKQYFPFETLLQVRIMGYLRKDCLNGDLGALQEAVRCLVDLAHPSFGDEAHDNEAINQDLIGCQPAFRLRESLQVQGTGGEIGRAPVHLPLVKKLKWRVLKKVADVCIVGQQFFDRAPELRIMAAGPIEE